MQKQVAGMENPLIEAGAFAAGSRVAFRHDGHALEPTSGQFVMDFEPHATRQLAAKPQPIAEATDTAHEWFARGVAMEDDPASQTEAVLAYYRVLEIDPTHAPAHINLGTIFYNQRDFKQAEAHYRAAIEADPRYALAHFDLGNVLDETGRAAEAVEAYKTAILLAPTYADAHYNLALAYERIRQPRKALLHWRTYLKLDSQGPWATHARHQIQKILRGDVLKVVYRGRQ